MLVSTSSLRTLIPSTAKKITIEAQTAADKLSEEAKEKAEKTINDANAKAEATTKEAEEKSEKLVAEADKKAEKIIKEAEEYAENVKLEVSEKADGLDKISEEIRSTFKTDIDGLKEKLKNITDALAVAEEELTKTVSDADKKLDDYGKTMFDKKSLDEYIKTLPPVERPSAKNGNNAGGPDSKVSWAMDDLEALTKQVQISTENAPAPEKKEKGSKHGEKWKNDLAALAKEAEIEVVD